MEQFIKSLHRPYNSRLKTCRWVCDFAFYNSKIKHIEKSKFTIGFYMFLIGYLHRLYNKHQNFDSEGLPSENLITEVYNYLIPFCDDEQISKISSCIDGSKKNEGTEKKIFSSYKAASYFINFAKNTLNLIDKENQLTTSGEKLLSLRNHHAINLSLPERTFFIETLIKVDLLMLVVQASMNRYEKKYKLSQSQKVNLFLEFINNHIEAIKLKQFNYTTSSMSNYMIVRSRWLDDLRMVTKNNYISISTKKIISENGLSNEFQAITNELNLFEKSKLKKLEKYNANVKKFFKIYSNIAHKQMLANYRYVNLYDIKEQMYMSYNKFQAFLGEISEDREYKYKLHFNNILHSIDGRKRFYVKNVPIINVKITGE